MNIRERLEAEHSKTVTLAVVSYIGRDKKRFRELMTILLDGEYRLTQRAAWPLSHVAIEHPELIAPYYAKLIQKLESPNEHPAIARNILRIFQECPVPEKHWGSLIDICFKFIMSETKPAAIRAFAITVASRICRHFPELRNELILMLRELSAIPQLPAVKQRTKLALKELQAVKSKF